MLIRAVSVVVVPASAVSVGAVPFGAGHIATAPMNLDTWYWGEFAGRRTETGSAPFPAAGA